MAAWVTHKMNDEKQFSLRKSRIIATEKITTYGTNLVKLFKLNIYFDNGGTTTVGERLSEETVDSLIAQIEAPD